MESKSSTSWPEKPSVSQRRLTPAERTRLLATGLLEAQPAPEQNLNAPPAAATPPVPVSLARQSPAERSRRLATGLPESQPAPKTATPQGTKLDGSPAAIPQPTADAIFDRGYANRNRHAAEPVTADDPDDLPAFVRREKALWAQEKPSPSTTADDTATKLPPPPRPRRSQQGKRPTVDDLRSSRVRTTGRKKTRRRRVAIAASLAGLFLTAAASVWYMASAPENDRIAGNAPVTRGLSASQDGSKKFQDRVNPHAAEHPVIKSIGGSGSTTIVKNGGTTEPRMATHEQRKVKTCAVVWNKATQKFEMPDCEAATPPTGSPQRVEAPQANPAHELAARIAAAHVLEEKRKADEAEAARLEAERLKTAQIAAEAEQRRIKAQKEQEEARIAAAKAEEERQARIAAEKAAQEKPKRVKLAMALTPPDMVGLGTIPLPDGKDRSFSVRLDDSASRMKHKDRKWKPDSVMAWHKGQPITVEAYLRGGSNWQLPHETFMPFLLKRLETDGFKRMAIPDLTKYDKKYGLPTGLLNEIFKIETNGDCTANSWARDNGAFGCLQLMIDTYQDAIANGATGRDPTNLDEAINIAATWINVYRKRHAASLNKNHGSREYKDQLKAMYNSGPGGVLRALVDGKLVVSKLRHCETQYYVARGRAHVLANKCLRASRGDAHIAEMLRRKMPVPKKMLTAYYARQAKGQQKGRRAEPETEVASTSVGEFLGNIFSGPKTTGLGLAPK